MPAEHVGRSASRIEVARRIIDARRHRQFTQRDLAEQLRVPLGTVDRLEEGLLDPAELLAPLSKALGRSKSWLLHGSEAAEDVAAVRLEDFAVLELRLRDIERRVAALAGQREELGRRLASVQEREVGQLDAAAKLEAQAADLDSRERAIEERTATLSAREAFISKLEAELRSRTTDLVRDAAELEAAQEALVVAQADVAAQRRALEAVRIATQDACRVSHAPEQNSRRLPR